MGASRLPLLYWDYAIKADFPRNIDWHMLIADSILTSPGVLVRVTRLLVPQLYQLRLTMLPGTRYALTGAASCS